MTDRGRGADPPLGDLVARFINGWLDGQRGVVAATLTSQPAGATPQEQADEVVMALRAATAVRPPAPPAVHPPHVAHLPLPDDAAGLEAKLDADEAWIASVLPRRAYLPWDEARELASQAAAYRARLREFLADLRRNNEIHYPPGHPPAAQLAEAQQRHEALLAQAEDHARDTAEDHEHTRAALAGLVPVVECVLPLLRDLLHPQEFDSIGRRLERAQAALDDRGATEPEDAERQIIAGPVTAGDLESIARATSHVGGQAPTVAYDDEERDGDA